MYKTLTKANKKLQEARINQKTWTKGDILAFAKMMNSFRFSSPERRIEITALHEALYEHIEDNGGYAITEEQSHFGIQWLKDRILTKSGKPSKSKFAADFRDYDVFVIKDFQRFEFMGFYANEYTFNTHYTPIYRTIGKDGRYFDYTMQGGHWGRPIILDRGQITPKLERILA